MFSYTHFAVANDLQNIKCRRNSPKVLTIVNHSSEVLNSFIPTFFCGLHPPAATLRLKWPEHGNVPYLGPFTCQFNPTSFLAALCITCCQQFSCCFHGPEATNNVCCSGDQECKDSLWLHSPLKDPSGPANQCLFLNPIRCISPVQDYEDLKRVNL